MSITHIVVYNSEDDYFLFPCSSLENAYARVEKLMREALDEQEFFQEIIEALDEKRFGDAMNLYKESQWDEQFFIHSVESENIDKSPLVKLKF